MKVICVKSVLHPKISFIEGEEYEYYINESENLYIMNNGKYIRSFNKDNFKLHFMSVSDYRDKRINDLGI